ncbi:MULTISPECIES: hypothetical protein [Streptomyces]|uniref:D-alanyl-D-alanine carboxypeptidase n=2 Tax=Streptomyces TaxID=1883 RepID=A0ABV9WKX1_9ACTN|nr:hypothetical protein [Streptomyces lienomycini]
MRGVAWAALCAAGVGAVTALAVDDPSEPEQRPAPPRVYSSCLAADTKPSAAGDDPCDGR